MADKKERETTRRAYTLRLSGLSPTDTEWRDALWQTHEAVNKGAKVFGDWLLTLRGGLDHNLVNFADSKGKESSEPTEEERRSRRILLALSWLSVESERGAPEEFKVEQQEVVEVFKKILAARGVGPDEVEVWVKDCSPSLKAAIRDDAVWVNRSGVFDSKVKLLGDELTREDGWDLLEEVFGGKETYFSDVDSEESKNNRTPSEKEQNMGSTSRSNDSKEDKGKDFAIKARGWLSRRFGTGKGADFEQLAKTYREIKAWAENQPTPPSGGRQLSKSDRDNIERFKKLTSAPGHRSKTIYLLQNITEKNVIMEGDLIGLRQKAEEDSQETSKKTNSKGPRRYSNQIRDEVQAACRIRYVSENKDQTGEFSVMLDHAARRVSLAHTWIKKAEATRRKFERDSEKGDDVPVHAKAWLESYCRNRSDSSRAHDSYRIRRRAIGGWKEVVDEWSRDDCTSVRDRIETARRLQQDRSIDKFGDIRLFEDLAQMDAICTWSKPPIEDGKAKRASDPQILNNFVDATEAKFNRVRFKVPAYRHPDVFLHPIFCDFGDSRWSITPGKSSKGGPVAFPRTIELKLLTPEGAVKPFEITWQSKRVRRDFESAKNIEGGDGREVARADRHGRATGEEKCGGTTSIIVPISNKLNGRLQVSRAQLEELSKFKKDEWDHKTLRMRRCLNWFITYSADLTPKGPGIEYGTKRGFGKKWWKKPLSRRPGLRILSVDLGHRHAAACAVWEVMNREQIEEACRDCGCDAPTEQQLFLHLKGELKKKNKKGEEVEVAKTTIYRRIGADTIEDGQPHPGPWARLDRQFLIKLQGEERGVRKASNEEVECIDEIKKELGRQQQSNEKSAAVDEVMFSAVSTLRNAMKRHGDRARIAFAINSNYQVMPGGQKYYFDESKELSIDDDAEKRSERHIAFIQDMLICWRSLFSTEGWQDDEAREAWDRFIKPLLGDVEIKEGSTNISRAQRRKEQEQVREKLKPAATALIDDLALRDCIYKSWSEQWEDKDVQLRRHIKTISRMILPRSKKTKDPTIRKVGGLSLTRIATLTEFRRKVQVGFFTRLRPDGTREEAKEGFGQRTLDALERLRDQRVKQLASRIVEAALGIGRMAHTSGTKDQKRPVSQVDKVCHAVVVENLKNYRPKETRSRRENRQLAEWSSSRIAKYLGEACELHGLGYKEVSAAYTSQQDSRTGAPGIRCQDVPTTEKNTFWKNQVTEAEKKDTFRSRYIEDLHQKFKKMSDKDRSKHPFVRIPQRGGDIFVSAESTSSAAKGIQADLNAAANIGLKALVDLEFGGAWWFVPCDQKGYPVKDKVKGYQIIKTDESLLPEKSEDGPRDSSVSKKRSKGSAEKAEKRIINLWCDISATDCHSRSRSWLPYEDYWSKGEKSVESRVVKILRDQSKVLKNELNGRSEDEEMPF